MEDGKADKIHEFYLQIHSCYYHKSKRNEKSRGNHPPAKQPALETHNRAYCNHNFIHQDRANQAALSDYRGNVCD